uniref:8-amino-7-oxononanoate synthase n=1 Tax=Candidatus Kentrum sp. FM TaxID=2126340 RepID=A0A450TH07_9GAMM|nr:MAG: 8-amino-7-oxononanoate synthase [Candidatus Kentron sp. FM]VFJ66486.1 MAG: 8-amino-7-oxononanoate synthase [Candidatus Kentron sp. FM]VFK16281.1 MAG: 8-amino-7-oxononanoate synthase [Candidatus Kentron sp. FM]
MDAPLLQATTLAELLRHRAEAQPDKTAYTFLEDGETEEGSLTYAQLDRQARAIAARLQKSTTPGGRVLLLYHAGLDFIAAFFGCLYAGVIAVPTYPPRRNRADSRFQAIAEDAQASVVLSTGSILSGLDSRLTEMPELRNLHYLATDNLDPGVVPAWQMPDIDANTLAFLQYTSGSTGAPKGVMISHGNLLYNEEMVRQGFGHTENTIAVGWLPLFHDMGLIGNVLQPLYLGIHCILFPPTAFLQNPLRWLRAISRYRATTSGGPNFAYDLCVEKITAEQRLDLDLSCWTVAYNGAEPIRAETLERFAETFAECGFRREALYPTYGMAETTLFVSGDPNTASPVIHELEKASLEKHRVVITPDGGDTQKIVGCGRTWLHQRIVIADPESSLQCSDGEIGEIRVSGKNVAQGYWNRPEETEQTFHTYLADTGEGPFLRTGDLGFLKDGELFVTGRLKDLIIIRGQNHYPQDIERTVEEALDFVKANACAATSITIDGKERLVMVMEAGRDLVRKIKAVRKQQTPSPEEHSGASARAREELERTVGTIAARVRAAVAEKHEIALYALALVEPRAFPRTSSGKVRRHACRGLFLEDKDRPLFSWYEHEETDGMQGEPAEDAPSMPRDIKGHHGAPNRTGQRIHDCFIGYLQQTEHLGVDRIDYDRAFTSLGIDLLGMATIRGALERTFGRKLSLDAIHEFDTVHKLAAHLESSGDGDRLENPDKSRAGGIPLSQIPSPPLETRTLETRTDESVITDWLVGKIGPLSGAKTVDIQRPFTDYGVDSIAMAELSAELGAWLDQSLSPALAYDYPTIETLAGYLAATRGTETRPSTPVIRESCAIPREHAKEIPERFYNTDCFGEYQWLQEQKESFDQRGIDNPYFRVNEAITGATTRIENREFVSFSSYNYLGLSGDPRVSEAARDAIRLYGTSPSASRVATGEKPIHGKLERAIARFLNTEDCLVFVSGHATNVTVIGHLFSSPDLIVHDALAHNSIVQGSVLSGATRIPFAHNDPEALDAILSRNRHNHERVLIVVEGVYSMDGDIAPLPRLIEIKNRHKAILMVDEAHAMGVLGESGRGVGEYYRVDSADVDIWMGTLSKALASCGGYIAGKHLLIEYLKYTAPGFLYSVGITPANAAAALAALEILRQEPERLERLHRNARLFLEAAKARGLDTGSSHDTPIVPIITGESMGAFELAHRLFQNGINVHPVVAPAVPEGEARLRFFITSEHTKEQIDYAVDQIVIIGNPAG